MSRICVVGSGYVGLVTAACFAEMGHRVASVDLDRAKISALWGGTLPIYERDLEPIVLRHMKDRRLSFTTSYEIALQDAEYVFMCVGTPASAAGDANLSFLHRAYLEVFASLSSSRPIIVNKSTVPPGTSDMMGQLLGRLANGQGAPPIVANPEFLREGRAVQDFMNPSRVVIGSKDPRAADLVAELYRPLECPILLTDTRTAEMVKYASNAFLATRVSFINEIAVICESLNVDVRDVAAGMGLDPRIGKEFLNAGIGYGGSCLPKDIAVLARLSSSSGHEPKLLRSVSEINANQPGRLVARVAEALETLSAAKVAVLGLTFKAHTDDVRASPALQIVEELAARGARVNAYDPQVSGTPPGTTAEIDCFGNPLDAVKGCDAVIIGTDWPEFKDLDLDQLGSRMKSRVLADGRNVVDPDRATAAGFIYIGVGRGVARTTVPAGHTATT